MDAHLHSREQLNQMSNQFNTYVLKYLYWRIQVAHAQVLLRMTVSIEEPSAIKGKTAHWMFHANDKNLSNYFPNSFRAWSLSMLHFPSSVQEQRLQGDSICLLFNLIMLHVFCIGACSMLFLTLPLMMAGKCCTSCQ